jgi:transglutaminase-like putative cysteine protease
MRYRIKHRTSYYGVEPISVGHNQAWLKPRPLARQLVLSHQLEVSPQPSICTTRPDTFGNEVYTFSFNEGYLDLHVEAISEVLVERLQSSFPHSPTLEEVTAAIAVHGNAADFEALQYQYDSPMIASFEAAGSYASESLEKHRPLAASAIELMNRIHEDFEFDSQATTVSTPVSAVFEHRKGVCQDFAHVMLAMLRSQGVAARYVSGYIRTYPPPGQPRLIGADASHAWVSVYCGTELGWLDLDPTNNKVVSEEHVTVAWGRDYSDIPPLRGVFVGGGNPRLEVSVDMEPVE